jgi:tRNA threonylcarbamoyladenosine modification (KEOPS) complex  Pcc1 subunit
MASQRVRKKRWAITMPRQRAAISLQIAATSEATARAAAAMPSPNPLIGAGPPGGPNECGTGGCGASDKSALRIAAASYLKNPKVEERSSEFTSQFG